MFVLALDTSTPAVTAGVCELSGEGRVATLAQRVTLDARAHAELLTPHVVDCLAEAGLAAGALDAVVVGSGPGPFTGLRVGMATAAAFADALGVPVHGVCSLDALAARVRACGVCGGGSGEGGACEGDLLVVTDARRREAYRARYAPDGRRVDGPAVGPAADVDTAGVGLAVGDATRLGELGGGVRTDASVSAPDAASLVAVAAGLLLGGAEPAPLEALYLRRPDAVPPRPRPVSAALRGTDAG